jgi:hypothetical protein
VASVTQFRKTTENMVSLPSVPPLSSKFTKSKSTASSHNPIISPLPKYGITAKENIEPTPLASSSSSLASTSIASSVSVISPEETKQCLAALHQKHEISFLDQSKINIETAKLLKDLKNIFKEYLLDIRIFGSTVYSANPSSDLDIQLVFVNGFKTSSCREKIIEYFQATKKNIPVCFTKMFLAKDQETGTELGKATLSFNNLDLNFVTEEVSKNSHQYFEIQDAVFISIMDYLDDPNPQKFKKGFFISHDIERTAYLAAHFFATKDPLNLSEPLYTFVRFSTKYQQKIDVQPGVIFNFLYTETKNLETISDPGMYFTHQLDRLLDNHFNLEGSGARLNPKELNERVTQRIFTILNLFGWLKSAPFLSEALKKIVLDVLKERLKNDLTKFISPLKVALSTTFTPVVQQALSQGAKLPTANQVDGALAFQVHQLIAYLSSENNSLTNENILDALRTGDWADVIFHIFANHPNLCPQAYTQQEILLSPPEIIDNFVQGIDHLIRRGLQLPKDSLLLDDLTSFDLFLDFEAKKTPSTENNKQIFENIITKLRSGIMPINNYELLAQILQKMITFYQNLIDSYPQEILKIRPRALQNYVHIFRMLANLGSLIPNSEQLILNFLPQIYSQFDNEPVTCLSLTNALKPLSLSAPSFEVASDIKTIIEKVNLHTTNLSMLPNLIAAIANFCAPKDRYSLIILPLLEKYKNLTMTSPVLKSFTAWFQDFIIKTLPIIIDVNPKEERLPGFNLNEFIGALKNLRIEDRSVIIAEASRLQDLRVKSIELKFQENKDALKIVFMDILKEFEAHTCFSIENIQRIIQTLQNILTFNPELIPTSNKIWQIIFYEYFEKIALPEKLIVKERINADLAAQIKTELAPQFSASSLGNLSSLEAKVILFYKKILASKQMLNRTDLDLLSQIEAINPRQFANFLFRDIKENNPESLSIMFIYLIAKDQSQTGTAAFNETDIIPNLPIINANLAARISAFSQSTLEDFIAKFPEAFLKLTSQTSPRNNISSSLRDIIICVMQTTSYHAPSSLINSLLNHWQQYLSKGDLAKIGERLFRLDPELKNKETRRFIDQNFEMALDLIQTEIANRDAFFDYLTKTPSFIIPETILMRILDLSYKVLSLSKFIDFFINKIPPSFLAQNQTELTPMFMQCGIQVIEQTDFKSTTVSRLTYSKSLKFFKLLPELPVSNYHGLLSTHYFQEKANLANTKDCFDLSSIFFKWSLGSLNLLIEQYQETDARSLNAPELSLANQSILNHYLALEKSLNFYLEKELITKTDFLVKVELIRAKSKDYVAKIFSFNPEYIKQALKRFLDTPMAFTILRFLIDHNIPLTESDATEIQVKFHEILKTEQIKLKDFEFKFELLIKTFSEVKTNEGSRLSDLLLIEKYCLFDSLIKTELTHLDYEHAKLITDQALIIVRKFLARAKEHKVTNPEEFKLVTSFLGIGLFLERKDLDEKELTGLTPYFFYIQKEYFKTLKDEEKFLFIENFCESYCSANFIDLKSIDFLSRFLNLNLNLFHKNPDTYLRAMHIISEAICNTWIPQKSIQYASGGKARVDEVSSFIQASFSCFDLFIDSADIPIEYFLFLLKPVIDQIPALKNHPSIYEIFNKLVTFFHEKQPLRPVLEKFMGEISPFVVDSITQITYSPISERAKEIAKNIALLLDLGIHSNSISLLNFKQWIYNQLEKLLEYKNLFYFIVFYDQLSSALGESIFSHEFENIYKEFEQTKLRDCLMAYEKNFKKCVTDQLIGLLVHKNLKYFVLFYNKLTVLFGNSPFDKEVKEIFRNFDRTELEKRVQASAGKNQEENTAYLLIRRWITRI